MGLCFPYEPYRGGSSEHIIIITLCTGFSPKQIHVTMIMLRSFKKKLNERLSPLSEIDLL